ncbi:hypothetical protein EDB19DRAFT_1912772 [Suillus lakei]|nr:hypothetical protein EDB19DRAFT_1912772 [Suillus lakei]
MLIYFLLGSLPWLTNNHEKLSTSDILEHKVDTTITVLCDEDPNYNYLRSLLCSLRTTETGLLDFIQPNDPVIHSPTSNIHSVAEVVLLCLPKATPVRKSSCVLCPRNGPLPPTSTPCQKKKVVA